MILKNDKLIIFLIITKLHAYISLPNHTFIINLTYLFQKNGFQ